MLKLNKPFKDYEVKDLFIFLKFLVQIERLFIIFEGDGSVC